MKFFLKTHYSQRQCYPLALQMYEEISAQHPIFAHSNKKARNHLPPNHCCQVTCFCAAQHSKGRSSIALCCAVLLFIHFKSLKHIPQSLNTPARNTGNNFHVNVVYQNGEHTSLPHNRLGSISQPGCRRCMPFLWFT